MKSLWIDKKPAGGMEAAEHYDPSDYEFIPAKVNDNPIYASDEDYLKTLRALPSHLRRAFLDGDWEVFAGQYFENFDYSRHAIRPEEIEWKDWWPLWISVDWGFEHPAATYWHTAIPHAYSRDCTNEKSEASPLKASEGRGQVATYREYVTRRTPPRELAHEIIARSDFRGQREKIDAIYLSPDAFARRTDEASIAEQMGDILSAAGFPRPIPADNDRIGGWMLMYQMLEAEEWLLTENCVELIRTLPSLVRDPVRIEDVEKMDGDDPADAARYGLKSRYAVRSGSPDVPFEQRLAARVTSADPTIRAMQAMKAQLEEGRRASRVSFLRRRH